MFKAEPQPTPGRGPIPPDAVLEDSGRGRLWLWSPRPGLVASVAEGRFTRAMAVATLAFVDAAAPKPLTVFHDWFAVSDYDSSARSVFTTWLLLHPHDAKAYHLAIGSKLVAMGVSVAALATGAPLYVHRSRAAFAAQLAAMTG